MKRTHCLCRVVILATGMLVTGCVTFSRRDFTIEELAGTTWINEEYLSNVKVVVTHDNKWETYFSMSAEEPTWVETYEITDTWYRGGDLWFRYTSVEKVSNKKWFGLSRISEAGSVWESCFRGSGYPTALDPLEGGLSIYFRKTDP